MSPAASPGMLIAAEFEQATRSFRSSKVLLDDGDTNGSANRLYYALFHAARAPLMSRSADVPRSHSGLIAAFGSQFVKSGEIDLALGKLFNRVEHERLLADYSGEAIDAGALRRLFGDAELFLSAVEVLVEQRLHTGKS